MNIREWRHNTKYLLYIVYNNRPSAQGAGLMYVYHVISVGPCLLWVGFAGANKHAFSQSF